MADQSFDFELVVVRPFADFQRGDVVADSAEIQQVLDGENAHEVVKRPKQ